MLITSENSNRSASTSSNPSDTKRSRAMIQKLLPCDGGSCQRSSRTALEFSKGGVVALTRHDAKGNGRSHQVVDFFWVALSSVTTAAAPWSPTSTRTCSTN